MEAITIFVRLVGERTETWRPVDALFRGDGIFEIAGPEQPADERWEFPVGSAVRCEPKTFNTDRTVFGATSRARLDG